VSVELPGVDPLKYQTPPKAAGGSTEWLTVKMRYKQPDGEASKELVAVLPAGEKPMGEDFQFAAAVAEFGLVLRDSPYKGGATFADVLSRAAGAAKYDPNGHRAEFLTLVRLASHIKERAAKE
jgi:Ca-activated chloride channel family protein